jgi:hypothetical protein
LGYLRWQIMARRTEQVSTSEHSGGLNKKVF